MLFGGLEHLDYFYLFFHNIYGNVIIPIDFRIFFRGVGLNHQPECGLGNKNLYSYNPEILFFVPPNSRVTVSQRTKFSVALQLP